ncbi:MAG: efflux transporter outer membrane subunit [Verrucomicrobiota bacterium]
MITGTALITTLLVSCRILPELRLPEAAGPEAFKSPTAEAGEALRTDWWQSFQDEELNQLIERIDGDNLELQAALARADQAYATFGLVRSEQFPALEARGSVQRRRRSGEDRGGFASNPSTEYRAELGLGWEIDLWGRVRRLVEAGQAEAFAADALVADVLLALRGLLARNYFALRTIDREKQVLEKAVETREDNLRLVQRRFAAGITPELDVARAETELATTRSDLAGLQGPRTRLENAIAVLAGRAPSDFHLAERDFKARLPAIRAGIPMDMLAARPDVAAAKSTLVAAHARIGVARAEYFPRLTLIGSGGLSSIEAGDFLEWSSRTFAIGPEGTLPVFQGGRLRANEKRARAEFAEAVADYRQTVLNALGDVDNALADLAAARDQTGAQKKAVEAAGRALALSNTRYRAGLVSSLEVVDAVREQLEAERRAVQIQGQQFEATVWLIQGLGGGHSVR